jgi:hypothetical protein
MSPRTDSRHGPSYRTRPVGYSSKVQQQGRSSAMLRVPQRSSRVLNAGWRHPCAWFGTKRPQVQILSPRPYSRRSEARTRNGEGLSCCQYRNEIPQVPQQIRILTRSSNGLPSARIALRSDEEAVEGKCQIEHSKWPPQPTLRLEGRHRAGLRIDPQGHRHVCVSPDRMITRCGLAEPPAALRRPASRREPSGGGHRPDRIEK